MSVEKLKVGQTLWWVPRNPNSNADEVKVTAVGRKWAQLANHRRIDVVTLEADGAGYASPGRCYRDRAVYEAEAQLTSQWVALRRSIADRYVAPDGVTMSQIKQARELLGL